VGARPPSPGAGSRDEPTRLNFIQSRHPMDEDPP
jgi:hypothetical protein